MNFVKNKLTVTGGMEDLLIFISENYERVYPCENKDISDYILFFDRLFPTPDVFLINKEKAFEWRLKNWSTPIPAQYNQANTLTVLYRHDYDYTEYYLSNLNNKFNGYLFYRLFNELDFYSSNLSPDENELMCVFETLLCPPFKVVENWIQRYNGSTLKFRLDYYDTESEFAGIIYFDYNKNIYELEHYSKETDDEKYRDYLIKIGVDNYER